MLSELPQEAHVIIGGNFNLAAGEWAPNTHCTDFQKEAALLSAGMTEYDLACITPQDAPTCLAGGENCRASTVNLIFSNQLIHKY